MRDIYESILKGISETLKSNISYELEELLSKDLKNKSIASNVLKKKIGPFSPENGITQYVPQLFGIPVPMENINDPIDTINRDPLYIYPQHYKCPNIAMPLKQKKFPEEYNIHLKEKHSIYAREYAMALIYAMDIEIMNVFFSENDENNKALPESQIVEINEGNNYGLTKEKLKKAFIILQESSYLFETIYIAMTSEDLDYIHKDEQIMQYISSNFTIIKSELIPGATRASSTTITPKQGVKRYIPFWTNNSLFLAIWDKSVKIYQNNKNLLTATNVIGTFGCCRIENSLCGYIEVG